tara:strand:- start:54 stop:953 length:900 start_codon:yes stop_codon:yes gene_type:complete
MIKEIRENPLVSVLLNCYNAQDTISKAIKSVLSQTYKNIELIIWDDASKDKTLEIVKSFKDKRVKLFENNLNIGLGKSRLKAIKELNGELISIIDADDFYENEKIEKQVSVFQKNPEVSICATWSKIFDENFKKLYFFESNASSEIIKKKLKFVNIIPHSSIMYRKKTAMDVGWYSINLEYSQDYNLTLKLINKGEIFVIKEFLSNMISGKNNMSNSKKMVETVLKENIQILENNLNIFENTKGDQKIINSLRKLYLIRLNIIMIKRNFFKSLLNISKIFFSEPSIIFKINMIKSIKNT